MDPRDPTGDVIPDFLSDQWEGAREAIVQGGKSAEEAAEILEKSWQAQHDKSVQDWNEHLERRQRDQGGERENNRGQAQANPLDNEPNNDKAPDWLNTPTPSFLDIEPARHVLKKLEKKEFVEIWHFTAQGCRDAATMDLNAPDDTFGLINTNQGLLMQSVSASSSSKAIRDEDLSWEQLTEGKTRLIGCMELCGWSEPEITQLVKFFLNLDIHPIRSQQYGPQAIMRYQEKVRRSWTQSLRTGKPFAIGTINSNLLREYQVQIGVEILAKNNVSREPNSEIKQTNDPILMRNSCLKNSTTQHAPLRTVHPCSAPHLTHNAPLRTSQPSCRYAS